MVAKDIIDRHGGNKHVELDGLGKWGGFGFTNIINALIDSFESSSGVGSEGAIHVEVDAKRAMWFRVRWVKGSGDGTIISFGIGGCVNGKGSG